MVEKSKTMSKPGIKPIRLNNLEANLNDFDDDDMHNNYATDPEHQDPEIIEEKRQSFHKQASSGQSHSGYTVTPFTYDPMLYDNASTNEHQRNKSLSAGSIDFNLEYTPNTNGTNGRHSTKNSLVNPISYDIKVIREERQSEIDSSGEMSKPSLVAVNSDNDTLTLAPTNSDNQPTQTQLSQLTQVDTLKTQVTVTMGTESEVP